MGDHNICPSCGGQSLQAALPGCATPHWSHPSEEFEAGKDAGLADHANGVQFDKREQLAVWANASEDWRRGWGDGYESAAGVNSDG